MYPGINRCLIAAASYGLQIIASLVLRCTDGSDSMLLLGVRIYSLAFRNGNFLPPLIAQSDFDATKVAWVVALIVAIFQAAYAFTPGVFGILRQRAIDTLVESQFGSDPIFKVPDFVQLLALSSFLIGRSRL